MKKIMMMLLAVCTALLAQENKVQAQACNSCFTVVQDSTNQGTYYLDASCSTPVSFFADFEWIVDGVSWGIYPFATTQVSFFTLGTHNIDLIYYDGNCSDTSSQTVTVAPLCNASFSSYDAGGGFYYFQANNTFGTGNYQWYYGDGAFGSGTSASHQYTTAGTYTALCVYTDTANACLDSSWSTIQVTATSGVGCDLILFTQSFPGLGFNVNASSSIHVPGITQFEFFENGLLVQSGTTSSYINLFAVGTYTIVVHQLDNLGAVCDIDSITVTSNQGGGGTGCYACFYPTYITSDSILFDASCSVLSGGSLEWSINGAAYTAGPQQWSQTFAPGYNTVAMRVVDTSGNVCDSTYTSIYVYPPPCATCLTVSPIVGSTSDYLFDASCTGGNINSVLWLVDGNYITSTASSSFTYSFTSSGTYTVCAQTSDSLGNICNQACYTVSVTTPPATNFNIQGTVYKYNFVNWGSYQPVAAAEAKVYLIKLQTGGQLDAVDSTVTDASGQYTFQNKVVDDYRVKAALDASSADYAVNVPTYFQASAMWYNASVITLYTNLYGRDVFFLPGVNTAGPGFISGNVFQGANKKSRSTSAASVTLILVDASTGQPVMYAKPNAAGDYSFSDVPVGNYKLQGELLNRSSIPETINISTGNTNYAGKNFMFNDNVVVPTQMTLSVGKAKPEIIELAIAPNPAMSNVTIATTSKDATITVYDIAGKPVLSSKIGAAGTLDVDCSQWASGLYIAELSSKEAKVTRKFTKQ